MRELAAYERAADQVAMDAAALEAALFAERPAVFGHVVEVGGEVVGMALWFLSFSTWAGTHGLYLEDLYVRPDHRRRGWGRRLLATLAAECLARGYARMEWAVLDWNAPAIAFYGTLGAVAMDEWTVNRVTGEALRRLAVDGR